jgi:hypothetical protein
VGRRLRIGLVSVVLTMMLPPGLALSQARPVPTQEVSPAGVGVHAPTLAVAGNGRILVAWATSYRHGVDFDHAKIEARIGRIGHGWSVTQTLSRDGGYPVGAMGKDGTAAVAWLTRGRRGSSDLYLSVGANGHRLAKAKLVASETGIMEPLHVGVQPSGRVVLVWSRELAPVEAAGRSAVEYALATSGASPTHVGQIATSDYNGPGIAQADDGTVLVTFVPPYRAAAGSVPWMSSLPNDGASFTAPHQVSLTVPGGETLGVDPFAGPGGAALTLRMLGQQAHTVVNVALLEPSGIPDPPVAVTEGPQEVSETQALSEHIQTGGPGIVNDAFQLAFPTDGAQVAAWERSKQTFGDSIGIMWTRVMVAVRSPGAATFSRPVRLSFGGGYTSHPKTAVAGGTTIVLWAQNNRLCDQRIYAAVRTRGRAFSAGAPLSARYKAGSYEPCLGDGQLAVAGSDRYAVAGWVQSRSLHVATFKG